MDKLLKRTLNEKIPNQTKCSVGYIMAERPLSNPNTKIYIGGRWVRLKCAIIL